MMPGAKRGRELEMRPAWALIAAGFLALFAASVSADYSIPVSTTAEGGGRGSNDTSGLVFVVGQPSPLVAASNGAYSLTTGLVSLLLDVRPPTILHSPPSAAVPDRTDLEITADIEDDGTGVEAATVFYREGGLNTYRQRTMSRDGDSFSAVLPPSAVTEKGLVYYIEAVDLAGNRSRYPSSAPDSLIEVRVSFENLGCPFELPAGHYRMISLPGSTNADPARILVDDLGEYNRKTWRMGRWNSSPGCSAACYDEYPDVPDMDRGRAFWLISKHASGFDFSGLSTLSESPFKIHLERGWNQIGTPFAFDTDWLSMEILFAGKTYALNEEHIVDTDTIYVEDNLVSYDGAYHGHQSVMEPWRGYWIYNGSSRDVGLLVNPHGSLRALASSPAGSRELDVAWEIAVASPDFPVRTGLAGLSARGRDGWDPMDHHEPPAFADYLRLVFDKSDWGKYKGIYMTDIRHSSDEGAVWDFRVEASRSTSATVDISTQGRLPETWRVFLYDRARGLRVGTADLPYAFRLEPNRDFSLIAGTDEFIRCQESEGGIKLRPQIVGVAPNPFSHSIDIAYFTPGSAPAEIEVFSVEGRLIKSMTGSVGDGGIMTVTWKGDSDRGESVAPGLYFARLRTGTSKDTVKILKIR
jgi:hypothetical protein